MIDEKSVKSCFQAFGAELLLHDLTLVAMKLGFTSLDFGRGDNLIELKTSFAKTQKPRAG